MDEATRIEPPSDGQDGVQRILRKALGSSGRENDMTIRILRVLVLLCLGWPVLAVRAADPVQTEPVQTESVLAEETRGEETTATEAAEAEESGNRSIFSRLVDWFRGEPAQGATEPESTEPESTEPESTEPEIPDKDITLSDVHQATRDMIAEIEILRKANGVADSPREMTHRNYQAPIYAYTKSLEVMGKTARVQRRLGMIPVEVGRIPVKPLTPLDLHRSVQDIVRELRRIKHQLVVRDQIQPASVAGATAPSLVYKNLGDASYLLDGLVGRPTTPNDVHMAVLRIQVEMRPIAARLEAVLESNPRSIEGGKEPKEVAQQVLRATYKAINLQSALGMDASSVPDSTLVEVTPAEILDAANILLAEIVRIKLHLNVRSLPAKRPESRQMQLAQVFGQVLLIIRNLDIMILAADDTR